MRDPEKVDGDRGPLHTGLSGLGRKRSWETYNWTAKQTNKTPRAVHQQSRFGKRFVIFAFVTVQPRGGKLQNQPNQGPQASLPPTAL